jgi:hypothetical protein
MIRVLFAVFYFNLPAVFIFYFCRATVCHFISCIPPLLPLAWALTKTAGPFLEVPDGATVEGGALRSAVTKKFS